MCFFNRDGERLQESQKDIKVDILTNIGRLTQFLNQQSVVGFFIQFFREQKMVQEALKHFMRNVISNFGEVQIKFIFKGYYVF